VFDAFAANVTVPGPLTCYQLTVIAPGDSGNPSSDALPVSVALAGSVIAKSLPALTTGG